MSDGLVIRAAAAADTAPLLALCRRLDPADYMLSAWQEWLATPGDINLVALLEGRVVGSARAGVLGAEAFVQGLRVEPAARRQGIGKRLMLEVRERLATRGAATWRGVTGVHNHAARDLLASVGFGERRRVARRRRTVSSVDSWPSLTRQQVAAVAGPPQYLVSRPIAAHFRRLYFAASQSWLDAALTAGQVLCAPGVVAFFDPPMAERIWLHTATGEPAALLGLLEATFGREASGATELVVDAIDDLTLQDGLDTLGFAPAGADDRYVVLEASTGSLAE